MRTKDLIDAFLAGATKGKASNLVIEGDRLVNYSTTIAQRVNGRIILNVTKYSQTTSKHQTYLKHLMPEAEQVANVFVGTYTLC